MSRIIRGERVKNLSFNPIIPDYEEQDNNQLESPFAEDSGKKIIEEAVLKSDQAIKQAEEKAKIIERDSHQRGYREGYQEGLALAQSEIAGAVETICSAARHSIDEKWKVIRAVENNIVDLALEIAEKIISEQVKLNPEVVISVARKALLIAAERERIQIKTNPEDLEIMKAYKDDLISAMDGIEKIEIIADRRVNRGGCILETNAGNVDARIQSQLSQIDKALRGVVGSEQAGD